MSKYLRINQVAEQLGVSTSSVRLYVKAGRIRHDLTPSGQRIFKQEYVDEFLGKKPSEVRVFYTRSSTGDKKLLTNQVEQLTQAYGEPIRVYSDRGSGLNENRPQLDKLVKDAKQGLFTIISITQKDRLTRFGYKYLVDHLETLGVRVEVLGESKDKSLYDELLQDFMSLLASFSGKFYRLRGYEQKKQLLERANEELNKTHE